MKKHNITQNIKNIGQIEEFEMISLEELKEFEYSMAFNPFDTTGTGYLDEDFIEFLIERNEEAYEYYGMLEQSETKIKN